MKVIMLGATRGMGRALARLFAETGAQLFLLGHEQDDLEVSSGDLLARGAVSVGYHLCNLEDPETFEPALNAADEALAGFDTVVVTAGLFATQDKLEEDRDFTARLLAANFTNTVVFCEQVRERLLARGGGKLCVFSSVAGDRGRKPVALYGASKAGLSHYLESLDHKYRAEGLQTICVKPGFVRTGMTEGLDAPPFAAEPELVAKHVFRGIQKGTPVVYAPPIWGHIMRVIRMLPRSVMRRVGF